MRSRGAAQVAVRTLRPFLEVLPLNGVGVWVIRQIVLAALAVLSPALPGTRVTPVDTRTVRGARVRGEWVRGPGVERTDAAVLYLHGSAFMLASPRTHRGLVSRLSALSGLPVFASDYRLAPRHVFPAAADDVAAAFGWLAEEGFPAERVVVAGDSAGGHLAVDLTFEKARHGAPGPAGLALFSPLIDLTFALAAEQERTGRDPMVSARVARELVALYAAGQDPSSPRLRLRQPPGGGLPPTLIQAGGAEMLRGDAAHLAELLRAGGAACELQLWAGQMHVFQALPLIPEATRALHRAAAFITTQILDSPPPDAQAPDENARPNQVVTVEQDHLVARSVTTGLPHGRPAETTQTGSAL